VDRWEGLLRASGGAIEPIKSWWVLVNFVWDDNLDNFRYRSIDEMPGELTVRDHTGTRWTLERCKVHDSNSLDEVDKKVAVPFLNKLGHSRSTPRAV
jgi:hypothetical protein